MGARIDLKNLEKEGERDDLLLFGEVQSCIVASCSPQNIDSLEKIAREKNIGFRLLGEVTGKELIIEKNGKKLISQNTANLYKLWREALSLKLR